MKKKKNIIITVVMIVLIAIIAIILVKINSSNVKNKEAKGIKPGTETVKTTAAQISLIKEHVPIPL